MKVAEFALQHNVDKNAVFQYIRRHPELFEGHTSIENKTMHIDDTAIDILSEKYPLPVEIVQDSEAREKLALAMERIDQLQQRIDYYQQQIIELLQQSSQAETRQFLLEDRTRQIDELKEERVTLGERLDRALAGQMAAEERLVRMRRRTLLQRIRNVEV